MSCLVTDGGKPLLGEVFLKGAKNAVLPLLAATVLCGDKCVIKNCPGLSDVTCAMEILDALGCTTEFFNGAITVNTEKICCGKILPELMEKMRSSVMFAGPVLARLGRVRISTPGGCNIGERPIDIHLNAFRAMGAEVDADNKDIVITAPKLRGAEISLPFPSVGATENIMLAACLAEGDTIIRNAAREPEIVSLQDFINQCGGKIKGGGDNTIHIRGVSSLHGTEYTAIPDRIVCATYMFAVAATGGDVTVRGCNPGHMEAVCEVIEKMRCGLVNHKDSIRIISDGNIKSPGSVCAGVYPMFPTDAQPLLAASACRAEGKTQIYDSVFPERFGYVNGLTELGGKIVHIKNGIEICGCRRLCGGQVYAGELRGGAALVNACLAAEGKSVIGGLCYIDRGYEHIEKNFSLLGADIIRKTGDKYEEKESCKKICG